MKQLINIGSAVDVGDGDYMRKGGEKINHNFNDIYHELGDDHNVHSAGAWKIIDEKDLKGGIYFPKFGQSLILDTSKTSIRVHLPQGGPENYGKVIKIRDIFYSWADRPVEISPASGDTLKGVTGYTVLHRNLSNIELIYTSKRRWEYVETTQIDQHRADDLRSVVMNEFVAIEGQTDFPQPFGIDKFNPDGLEVYRRGNRLYYGESFSDISEYGSIDEITGEIKELDGLTIKLKHPCKEGDTIAFTSYLDGIETFRSSYTKRTYQLKDKSIDNTVSEYDNNIIYFDDEDYETEEDIQFITFDSKDILNIQSYDNLNPYALDIMLNGVLLTKMEDVGGDYYCSGVSNSNQINSPGLCTIKGGTWKPYERSGDYNLVYEGSKVVGIQFNIKFDNNDILTIKWFNNIIGSILTVDDIRTELDNSFFSTLDEYNLSYTVSIPEYEDIEGLPTQKDVVYNQEEQIVRPNTVDQIMNLVYPIGHIYQNLYNKESPELTLGFGKWRRLSGVVLAGFDDDFSNVLFGQNNNHVDSTGKPTPTPGGTFGELEHKLKVSDIPHITIDGEVLEKSADGIVDIGTCLADPDETVSPLNRKYNEEQLSFGMKEDQQSSISNLQPTMVVSMWVRVA